MTSAKVEESDEAPKDVESGESRCLRIESAVCATSTGWGLLANQPLWVLVLFWACRHLVYFGLVFLLFSVRSNALNIVLGVFIIYVHMHKIALFLRQSKPASARDDQKQVEESSK